MSSSNFDPIAAARRLGKRAVRACDLAAGGGEWTPRTISLAAQGLDSGSRAVGVTRRWPRLAVSLRHIATRWAAQRMAVKS